jgi:hypothetical protein
VNVEEEAALINANLDHVLDSLQADVEATYVTDPASILCTTRTQFVQYGWLHLHCGNSDWIISNYSCLAAALLRLLELRKQVAELEDAVAMRDSVIRSLGEIEDL